MVGKNNHEVKKRQLAPQTKRFGLRKIGLTVTSVLVGTLLLGVETSTTAAAAEVETAPEKATVTIEADETDAAADIVPLEEDDAVRAAAEANTTEALEAEADKLAVSDLKPGAGEEADPSDLSLEAHIDGLTDQELTAIFKEGYHLTAEDEEVAFAQGTVNDALDLEREEAKAFTKQEVEALADPDGEGVTVTSQAGLPYQIFTVAVPKDLGEGAKVRVNWAGAANGDAQVRLYALNQGKKQWEEIAKHTTQAGQQEAFTLTGLIKAEDFEVDGKITLLVQHSLGYAAPNPTGRDSQITPNHPDDRPRDQYDFTFAWETDTQFYNEQYFKHQVKLHDFLLNQRENMNIQYMIHSGDIVNKPDQAYQWINADGQYQRLDDAHFPYGILAGNHDVRIYDNDYTTYGEYFGEDRYQNNPWYGGSYANNRGHYDLLSSNGLDFLVLYMGWDVKEDQIQWLNQVLAQHPDREAILVFHEFLSPDGSLTEQPQQIMDQVVAKNPNVKLVLGGHHTGALTETTDFDDDGDGKADRTVTSMLFDYQYLNDDKDKSEGGFGYLRLLHFDHKNQQLVVRTYSDSLKDYNADDPQFADADGNLLAHQDFVVPYAQLGFKPQVKMLTTDQFSVDILTDKTLGEVNGLHTGDIAKIKAQTTERGQWGWYVHLTDHAGQKYDSPVQKVTLVAKDDDEEAGNQTSEEDKPETEKPEVDQPETEKPETEKPETEKPEQGQPEGEKPNTGEAEADGEKPAQGSVEAGKTEPGTSERPTDGKTESRPAGHAAEAPKNNGEKRLPQTSVSSALSLGLASLLSGLVFSVRGLKEKERK